MLRILSIVAIATFCLLEVQSYVNTVPPIEPGSQQGYVEGDLIVPNPKNRNGILKGKRWPNGIIYYTHGSRWAQWQLDLIKEAMDTIERHTCIRFVPRQNEPNYVNITNGGGCASLLGQEKGQQPLSLHHNETGGGSCFYHKTLVHEMMHTVGLAHEQTRYDRDQYITILWENMPNSTGVHYQFQMNFPNVSDTYGVPYNYLSAMHYFGAAFSKNGEKTIITKDPAYQDLIGNVQGPHELDMEKIRRIYECKGTYPHLEQKTTTPEPEPTTTQAPCLDIYPDCAENIYQCDASPQFNNKCRKSCGTCGELGRIPEKCTDKHAGDFCKSSLYECDTAYHKDNCRLSCGHCPGSVRPTIVCEDKHPECPNFKAQGQCSPTNWTVHGCRKTCGFCR